MRRALELARRPRCETARCRSAPSSCSTESVVGEGWNQPIGAHDPTAHAEIVAIRRRGAPARQLPADRRDAVRDDRAVPDVRRRDGPRADRRGWCTARREPKAGAIESAMRAHEHPSLNHRLDSGGGVLEAECRAAMQDFFTSRRGMP